MFRMRSAQFRLSSRVHKVYRVVFPIFSPSMVLAVILWFSWAPLLVLWPESWSFMYCTLLHTFCDCAHVLDQLMGEKREKEQSELVPLSWDHSSSDFRGQFPSFRVLGISGSQLPALRLPFCFSSLS